MDTQQITKAGEWLPSENRNRRILVGVQIALLWAFVCTLTLDQKMNSTILFGVLFSLLFSIQKRNLVSYWKHILVFCSIYFAQLIASIYSANTHESGFVLEKQMTMLFIPLMFFLGLNIQHRHFLFLLRAFYFSVLGICLYLIGVSAEQFYHSGLEIKEWFVGDNLYHAFSKPIDMHAIFLSLYVALAFFVGLNWLLAKGQLWKKIIVFVSNIVLVFTLAFLSSRVVIISVLAVLFLVFPFFMASLRQRLILMTGGFLTLLIFYFVIKESSFISDRFLNKTNDEVKMTSFLRPDSTYNPINGGATRADRWYCALELIREKPLTGHGTGSEKDKLMEKYQKYNLQNAVINKYDSHNQYLAFGIKTGLPGIILFLIAIVCGFYIALRARSFLYFSFMLLFAVACTTENVLESNKGIFFYAFFNTLFALYFLSAERGKKITEPL